MNLRGSGRDKGKRVRVTVRETKDGIGVITHSIGVLNVKLRPVETNMGLIGIDIDEEGGFISILYF